MTVVVVVVVVTSHVLANMTMVRSKGRNRRRHRLNTWCDDVTMTKDGCRGANEQAAGGGRVATASSALLTVTRCQKAGRRAHRSRLPDERGAAHSLLARADWVRSTHRRGALGGRTWPDRLTGPSAGGGVDRVALAR
jgi:hypothetical protein